MNRVALMYRSLLVIFRVWFVVLLLGTLSGCDVLFFEDNAASQSSVSVIGSVQKGSFTTLTVSAYPFSPESGELSEEVRTAETRGGTFSVELTGDRYYLLQATGTFIDEVSGRTFTVDQPLQGFVKTDQQGEQTYNLNLFTDFYARRVLALVENNVAVPEAQQQADQLVRQVFSLKGAGTPLEQADITGISATSQLGDPDVELLLLSGALMDGAPEGSWNLEQSGYKQLATLFGSLATSVELSAALKQFEGQSATYLYQKMQKQLVLPDGILNELEQNLWQCDEDHCAWLGVTQPTLSMSTVSAYESTGKLALRLHLSEALNTPLEVQFETENATAVAGQDFIAVSETVRFAAGEQTQVIEVVLLADRIEEATEFFNVRLSVADTQVHVLQTPVAVSILDGVPASAAVTWQGLSVQSLCFVGIGSVETLQQGVCSTGDQVHQYDVQKANALGIRYSLGCDANTDAQCNQPLQSIPLSFQLISEDSSGNEQARIALGSVLYLSTSLDGSQEESLLATVSDAELTALMQRAAMNGWSLKVEVMSAVQASLLATLDLPTIYPLPDIVTVTATEALKSAKSGFRIQSDDTGQCAEDELRVSGDFVPSGDLFFTTQSDTATATSVNTDFCARWKANDDGSVSLVMVSGDVDLGGILLRLPKNHFVFIDVGAELPSTNSTAIPGGFSVLPVTSAQTAIKAYVKSGDLPVAFGISGGVLSPDGIELKYSDVKYLLAPVFSASDPRANRANLRTNDSLFSQAYGSGSLYLTPSGISGDIAVARGDIQTAYPTGTLKWEATSVAIQNGQAAGHTPADITYSLEQNTRCPEIECLANTGHHEYTVKALQAVMDQQGNWLSPASSDKNTFAGWGHSDHQIDTFKRPDDFAEGAPSTVALTGFSVAVQEGYAVSDYLQAHVQKTANATLPLVLHPVGSVQAELGNYHPVGLSVGPELYSNHQGQVTQGSGQDLTGKRLLLRSHLHENTLVTGDAVKYVVRNAGVTGVINAPAAQLTDELTLQGYKVGLERFAVRFVDNKLDDYNWIDGHLALPGHDELAGFDPATEGDAGFDLYFSNLQLACSGNLGQANLLAEACDGVDNNTNGVVDENCKHHLASWRADSQVASMRFAPAVGDVAACGLNEQRLALHHSVDLKALSQPVGLQAQWSPAGRLLNNDVFFPHDDYVLEGRSELTGFPVVPSSGEFGVMDLTAPESMRYGTLLLPSLQAGVPFWDALQGDVRLANTLSFGEPSAEASVFSREGGLAQANVQQLNQSLQQSLIDSDQHDLSARYSWGNTGFGFNLPVYFSPAALNDGTLPSFIGRKKSVDLFVLEANAGINYIKPNRTELSFGASADIKKLKNLKFRVDLGAPDNLRKVDDLLVKTGVTQRPVIEPALSTLQEQTNTLNEFANQGIDELMEKALYDAVKRLGEAAAPVTPNQQDPFVTLSEAGAFIDSLPQRVITLLEDRVYQPLDQSLEQGERTARQELDAVLDDVRQLQLVPGSANTQRDALVGRLQTFRGVLQQVTRPIDELDQRIDSSLSEVDAVLTETDAYINQLTSTTAQIRAILKESVEFSQLACDPANLDPNSEANGYLAEVVRNMTSLESLMSTLGQADFALVVGELVSSDPDVQKRMEGVTRDIQDSVQRLESFVIEAKAKVLQTACSTDVSTLLVKADEFIAEVDSQVVRLQQFKTNIDTQLQKVRALKADLLQKTRVPVAQVDSLLLDLIQRLQEPPRSLSGAEVLDALETGFRNSTLSQETGINSLLADAEGEQDIFGYVFGRTRTELKTQFVVLREDMESVLAQLPAAYYTPDQLRHALVNRIMMSQPIVDLRTELNKQLAQIYRELNTTVLMVFDQINQTIKLAIARVESTVNESLEEALAPVRDIPLDAASLDGFAVITRNELERAHIGAEWTIPAKSEEDEPASFNAALDAVSWNANNKAEGCGLPSGDHSSRLDVTLSTRNLPANIASADILLRKLYLGFTLENDTDARFALKPIGVFGGIFTQGDIEFTELTIYDVGFAAGIGAIENYLGATAGMVFSDVQGEVAFLVGKTCNDELLKELDPRVGDFITVPATGFTGVYARGGASIPVWTSGCSLTVGVGADVGGWIIAGPPLTVGGLVGGSAYGKVLCVGALRGKLTALGQLDETGRFMFMGEGFGVAGVGDCEPASWTTVERSRDDEWCATGDAVFRAGYRGRWTVDEVSLDGLF